MANPSLLPSVWDDQRNVDTLIRMWSEGKTAAHIAVVLSVGRPEPITRNAVISKVHRMKLPTHGRTVVIAPSEGHGNKGQPKAGAIIARRSKRERAEENRVRGAHRMNVPHKEGRAPDLDDGVDCTHLIGGADRKIGHQCGWVHGTPGETEWGYCGKPVVEGTQWCAEHRARVYSGASN